MHRLATAVLTALLVAAFCAAPVTAQTSFTRNWEFSDNVNTKPSYLSGARALAWGMVSDGSGGMQEVVLVSHNANGPFEIEILDPSDGSNTGNLDVSGVADVSRDVQDVEISEDGVIIACNEVNNRFLTSSDETFRCYRWDSLTDSPTEVLAYTPPDQDGGGQADWIGRLTSVTGRADDNTLTIMTPASSLGQGNPDNIYRFTTADNGASFTVDVVDRTGNESTAGIGAATPLGTGASDFVVNMGGENPLVYASDGTFQTEMTSGVVSAFSHSIKYFSVGTRTFIGTFNYGSSATGDRAEFADVSAGFASALPEGNTPPLGTATNNNANGTGDLAVRVNGDNTITTFVLATNTGIGSYTSDTALPVELAGFTAGRAGSGAVLSWTTLAEENNSGFAIERSLDGRPFQEIGFEPGHGTTTESIAYSFTDAGVPYGTSEATYRLRQVDVDGTTAMSGEQSVRFTPDAVSLIGSVPNPVTSGMTKIRFELPEASHVRLSVYDVLGREVATLIDEQREARQHSVPFNASTLASGTYLIRIETDRGAMTQKMTVAR